MDPVSTILVAWGGKELVVKLLGPTADYLGQGGKNLTEKMVANVGNILTIATKKLGDKTNSPGQVPPKVLKGILSEGSFCEDELTAEYFGGVLASSRSEIPRDDRGSTYIALLGRLSTYQIRSHYLFYSILKKLYDGTALSAGLKNDRMKLVTYIPEFVFSTGLDLTPKEDGNVLSIHVMNGLARESLVDNYWCSGSPELLEPGLGWLPSKQGIVFAPSAIGVELFMWAHGKGDARINTFLNSNLRFEPASDVKIKNGSRKKRAKNR